VSPQEQIRALLQNKMSCSTVLSLLVDGIGFNASKGYWQQENGVKNSPDQGKQNFIQWRLGLMCVGISLILAVLLIRIGWL